MPRSIRTGSRFLPPHDELMSNDADQSSFAEAPFIGCTIADAVTFGQALVLASSFHEFHPQAQFAILLLDEVNERPALPPTTLIFGVGELDLRAGEAWRLPMLWSNDELAQLLQPAWLLSLMRKGARMVVYFASSTQIFTSLDDVIGLLTPKNAILASEPVRNDRGDGGRSFVAIHSCAEDVVRSWQDSVEKISDTIDQTGSIQSAFDVLPHKVVTIPGLAVSYWNLDPLTFAYAGGKYEVAGQSLRTFDFRGYDPEKPHLLSRFQGFDPQILLSEYPAIAQICDEYRNQVISVGYKPPARSSLGTRLLPSGLPIDKRMLRIYYEQLRCFRSGECSEPPSPFGPEGEEAFLRWLNEPVGQGQIKITRYMLAVRDDREDVKRAFADPLGADAAAFRNWYRSFGQRELNLSLAIMPDNGPFSNSIAETRAVNVAGYFRAELGLGVAARSILSALDAAAIPFNTISFSATENRQDHPFLERRARTDAADINILCVNPDQLPVFAEQTGPELRQGRYTIGLWFWEVEDFPKLFHGAFNYVDEIWVASDFMRQIFLKVSPKPVFKYVLPVLPPQIDRSLSRSSLGLPDKFIFLFSFDLLSVLERKNPLGLIRAFVRAFPSTDKVALVIKTINGDKRCLEMEKLRYAARGRPDIILMDGYLSAIENSTLTELSDCYVSLHRSEGFGLTMAEAMALGKPVIATGYSGNLEFMTSDNSYLCPARPSKVGPEQEPYLAGSNWSEPDVHAAADLLAHVYTQPEEAKARGRRGAESIRTFHSAAAGGAAIAERLATIRRRRDRLGPSRSTGFLEDRLEELEAEVARLRRKTQDR